MLKGILAANAERGYNYGEVLEWFADRCDIILLLFDAHQLDFSDEFKRIVEVLKKNEKKIRIVLNKADMVDGQSLIKLHSALMWSLSRVLTTPEVVRVYMGSFKDGPLLSNSFGDLFERESKDLLNDLLSLHRYNLIKFFKHNSSSIL
jgi:EH domain-containing protein 1